MSAENLREQIAETLVEHQYAIVTSPLRPACTCGWEAGAEWSGTEAHDLHVADAVLAVLGGDRVFRAIDDASNDLHSDIEEV